MKNCLKCNTQFHPQPGLINYCSMSCRNSRVHSDETKSRISKTVSDNYITNPMLIENARIKSTGKTLSTESKKKISTSIKSMYLERPELIEQAKIVGSQSTITDEGREKLRHLAHKRNFGGHTSKKCFYYTTKNGKVIYLQSSYEVTLAKSLDANNIEWVRPEPFLWFDECQVKHRYYPDFYLPEFNVYLDPKNDYLLQKDFVKIKSVRDQNGINILMFGEDHLEWDNLRELIDKW